MTSIDAYLDKRADLASRPLIAQSLADIDQVVVIPALAEHAHLSDTLDSLALNPPTDLARTLVICVVNQRADAPQAWADDNQRTLAKLRAMSGADTGLRLGFVDAASPGHEFGPKDGVGLARKIGMDHALAILRESRSPVRLVLSLDADTRVEPGYLPALRRWFEERNTWAGVTSYAHPLEGTERAAILCYELYLRYHVLGLRYARSPYAFHAIGSTIACRAEAYAAVSGMNRRQGGEDFYFLQQLAKTGGVEEITSTTVFPSPRPSERVPFGTGPRVRRFLDAAQDEYRLYHPDGYEILKDWLNHVGANLDKPGDELLGSAGGIAPALRLFLEEQEFPRVWERLRANARDAAALHAQFLRWFDGFRTIKLIHFLEGHGFPRQEMFAALALLMQRLGVNAPPASPRDLTAQENLLQYLRHLQTSAAGGSPHLQRPPPSA